MGGIPGSRGTAQRLRCVVRSGRFANCLHGRRGGSRDMHRPDVLSERLAVLAGAAFDPTDRLWRLGLYRLAVDEHVLAFAGHRAVFDARAQALLYADLAAAYGGARAGRPAELPPLRVVFA